MKRLALQRIDGLFKLAREIVHEKEDLAQRYVLIAQKIAMRTRVHLPLEYRLQLCRHCKKLILPGLSSLIRLQKKREPHIVVTCKYCTKYTRIPYGGKRK